MMQATSMLGGLISFMDTSCYDLYPVGIFEGRRWNLEKGQGTRRSQQRVVYAYKNYGREWALTPGST
jgi:hypothetical protein